MAMTDARKSEIAAEVGLAPEWSDALTGGSDEQVRASALAVRERIEAEGSLGGHASPDAAVRAMLRHQRTLGQRLGLLPKDDAA